MKHNPTLPPFQPEPTDGEIREYAYHLYEQSGSVAGRELDNWLEATACLKANIPVHHSHRRLHGLIQSAASAELHAPSAEATN